MWARCPSTHAQKQCFVTLKQRHSHTGCSRNTGRICCGSDGRFYPVFRPHTRRSRPHRLSKELSLSESLHNKVASMSRTILRLVERHKELQAEVRVTYPLKQQMQRRQSVQKRSPKPSKTEVLEVTPVHFELRLRRGATTPGLHPCRPVRSSNQTCSNVGHFLLITTSCFGRPAEGLLLSSSPSSFVSLSPPRPLSLILYLYLSGSLQPTNAPFFSLQPTNAFCVLRPFHFCGGGGLMV